MRWILVVILLLFVLSCAPSPEKQDSAAALLDGSASESGEKSIGVSSGACSSQWVCLNSKTKLFRLENCSFAQREECKTGCVNGTCKAAQVCTSGFKCHGTYYKGFQQEDCSWITETKCEYGCQGARCLDQPNETAVLTEGVTPPEVTPLVITDSWSYLSLGEKVPVTAGNGTYDLSIYILDPDRVQMKLGEKRSDWLKEGESYRFYYGVTITIIEILFQEHEAGIRKVGYTLE